MAVIITTFPDSEREWVQWIGRTARNDRKGQYAVILSKETTEIGTIDSNKYFKSENNYDPLLIGALAKAGDEAIAKKLERNRDDVKVGQRINELCDKFYAKYHSSEHSNFWPPNDQCRQLRDFIAQGDFDVKSTAKFYLQVGLIKSVEDYSTVYK
jgi:superfamily II DNA/RNA helicase